ncbi:MAG TPA: hypothetical protein G4O01_03845 [Dehalococcoidia bacterium]|nr:hypothetical protein [Dehalococcoidia bacterium]
MWVIIASAALAALLILALFVPLELAVQLSTAERPRLRMRLVWLFGLVRKEIGRGEKKPAAPKKTGKKRINPRDILSLLQTKGLLQQLKISLQGMLRSLEIKNLTADFKVGLGDPADTGLLFALLAPVILWLNSSLPLRISAQPSFADAPTFTGYSHGAVRVRPIRLVIPLLRFAISPATMRAVKKLVLARWRRK